MFGSAAGVTGGARDRLVCEAMPSVWLSPEPLPVLLSLPW
jgi:hypothetical protein